MLRSIQYLRAIAALMVVAKHGTDSFFEYAFGYGVDLFFVISGFVMVYSTYGKKVLAIEFLKRRSIRVLPMWWITMSVVALIGLVSPDPYRFLLSLFLIPYEVNAARMPMIVWSIGWTLVFEMIFYGIFAIGLIFRKKVIAPIALITLITVGYITDDFSPLFNPVLLEFLFGVFVAHVILMGMRPTFWLIPFGAILFGIGNTLPVNMDYRAIVAGYPLALILAGVVGMEIRGNLGRFRILGFIGAGSYSIYLLHNVPIILLAGTIPAHYAAMLGVALGCVAFVAVEKPIHNFLMQSVRRRLPLHT